MLFLVATRVILLGSLIALMSSHAVSDVVAPRAAVPATSNPFTEHALEESQRRWLAGRIEERLDAGHYVYLRLREDSGGEAWLVSLAATTPASDRVRALVLGRAAEFHSRRLARDFSPLLFAAVRAAAP